MSAPDTLFLKILLVPVLIASVTLVGRRYGQRVGGWLGSFPIVAGPILFILSFENGTEFGAAAAYSAFVAIVPAMIFYVVYARLAVRTSWWIAAAIGIVIWCLVAGLLWQLDLSMVLAAIAVVAALGWSARAMPERLAAEMHSGFAAIRRHCSMTCGQRVVLREIPTDVRVDLDRLAALWSMGLDRFGGPFLAGDKFCAVDAFFAPIAFRMQSYGLSLDESSDAYVARLLALPSMRDWYAAALVEPWRKKAYEEEIRSVAISITDLREPR